MENNIKWNSRSFCIDWIMQFIASSSSLLDFYYFCTVYQGNRDIVTKIIEIAIIILLRKEAYQMRIKKKAAKPLIILLAASQCMTSMAGTWNGRSQTEWVYVQEDGTLQTGGWFQDPADGRWYYLDETGVMQFGWKQVNGVWYFLNTMHDGTFGARLFSGWYWIDGYCYLFQEDGSLYVNTTTPDGFSVNADGKWIENGKEVYIPGKGILTAQNSFGVAAPTTKKGSSGSKGGGGGGSGGGSSSSSHTNYSYTIHYVEETGDTLASVTGEARKNSFIHVPEKSFNGYTLSGGQTGKQKVTSNGITFTVNYVKNGELVDPGQTDEPAISEKIYSYKVLYVDYETGNVIKTRRGEGKEGANVTIKDDLAGYIPKAGNQYTLTLTEDNLEVILYYQKVKKEFGYKILYMGNDGKELGQIKGIGQDGSTIEIPVREFDGYVIEDIIKNSFILNKDGIIIEIHYSLIPVNEDKASPSEPEKASCSYTIQYVDRDTMKIILSEKGISKQGSSIIPDLAFDDYKYAMDYKFIAEKDGDVFTVYLVKAVDENLAENCSYTVTCVDENGNILKVYEGTVTIADAPVAIYPKYQIDGYKLAGNNEFFVKKNQDNSFILEYISVKDYVFKVECIDIDTMKLIETVILYGNAGEELELSNICPNEYKRAGNLPDSVKVSTNEENNSIQIYYKKKTAIPDNKKEAAYTIQYRAYGNNGTKILNDLTGTWTVGEKLPVYFIKEVIDSTGKQWTAVGDSPRIFTVRDQSMNTFLIEYQHTGNDSKPDEDRVYSIQYIADDTGSVLGVTTGIGKAGDIIPYRNTFENYGFAESENSYTIMDKEDNTIEVIMERVKFPGHEINESTGLYDGYEWSAIFVDSNGNQLLPSVNGFTVKGDELYIDYPDVVEGREMTYRAVETSPYKCVADGTVYRQIIIQYITGNPSEDKLEMWKNKAQEKKDLFYGTTPYSYFISYMEKNSWNDIGLKFGVAAAGTEIEIECEEMEGWEAPLENLGSFRLSEDGMKTSTQYERLNAGTSSSYNKRSYEVHVVDTDGNDLFNPYTGYLAFAKGDSTCDFEVYVPDSFYDAQGNRWESDEISPINFTMSALDENIKSVRYQKVYENQKEQFVVEKNKDVNKILNDFAIHTYDAERHEFYLIGRNYHPGTAEVSDTMYRNHLAGYTNEVVDSFILNGVKYIVSLVSYYRMWDEKSCIHKWEYKEELKGSCLTATKQVVRCSKCGKEVTTIEPAAGHMDENYDSKCDVCKTPLSKNLGDEITVTWDSGSLGYGKKDYNFVCIDTDYQGTGKLLYVCESDIGSEIYGTYTNAESADYHSSSLRYFLDDRFASGLSVNTILQDMEGDAVSMLTKAEYDAYRAASINHFPFPSGVFLTKGDDMDQVTLTSGAKISKEDANQYPIRPTILLEQSEENQGIQTGIWQEGDIQARELDGTIYLFRCVDGNYTNPSNANKSLALFLCDTVIPANAGLGFDEADKTQSTRFFGETNNYKYSTIHEWLTNSKSKTKDFVMTNIGIVNEYSGATKTGKFQSLDVKSLIRHPRITAQVMYEDLFIPSVEDALSLKDYLWKFNGSDKNNASDIIHNYCEAYWLRTPQYGTSDMVYTINLKTGTIEPKSVKAVSGSDVSNTGIRPMYLVEQAY